MKVAERQNPPPVSREITTSLSGIREEAETRPNHFRRNERADIMRPA
jgi:hypothetical protein